MATNNENVTCAKLADSLKGLSPHCRETFWKCCTNLHGMEGKYVLVLSLTPYMSQCSSVIMKGETKLEAGKTFNHAKKCQNSRWRN